MLELLAYLRANGFKTFIVSGGGVEFMRPWAERVYGVPPEQVIGSSIKTKFEMRDGRPLLFRLPDRISSTIRPASLSESTIHRPPTDRRVRQFGRRSRNAAVDDEAGGRHFRIDCPSYRRRARIRLRPETSFGRLDKALDAAALTNGPSST